MKIERINENQIRCTLSEEDLSGRRIRLDELAYGSEKARQLFHDMMQEARQSVGFESDNCPLMIEAIPVAMNSLVLIITRVEDPEELDTRFSRFTRSDDMPASGKTSSFPGAEEVLDLFHKVFEQRTSSGTDADGAYSSGREDAAADAEVSGNTAPVDLVQAFRFQDLDALIEAAHCTASCYNGSNTVYHNTEEGVYILVLHQSDTEPEAFNRVCNILSEYGVPDAFTPVRAAWLEEHGSVMLSGRALQKLAEL